VYEAAINLEIAIRLLPISAAIIALLDEGDDINKCTGLNNNLIISLKNVSELFSVFYFTQIFLHIMAGY
jgi:hypothetical protein